MGMMQDSVVVAANAVSANQLNGQLYEFQPAGAPVQLLATGSATGLRCSMLAAVPVVNDQAIGLLNRFPIIPDDRIWMGRVKANCRLVLTFRNPTAGALTAFWRVDTQD
jgi:hypothetical protein